jgi:hypothetical protein
MNQQIESIEDKLKKEVTQANQPKNFSPFTMQILEYG